MPNPKDKDFKALQAKWYAKLEKSGFEDIEQDEDRLKAWSRTPFTRKTESGYYNHKQAYYESLQEYYRMAGIFLHEYKFKDKRERLIWELHSEGKGCRQVAEELRKRGHKSKYYTTIGKTIRALAAKMKAAL